MTKQNYATPPEFVRGIEKIFDIKFDTDVCAEPWSAKCDRYFTKENSAFGNRWGLVNWCNPPCRDKSAPIKKWIENARTNWLLYSSETMFLLPNSTGSIWFQDAMLDPGWSVIFLTGRINFITEDGPTKSNDRDSLLVWVGDRLTPDFKILNTKDIMKLGAGK